MASGTRGDRAHINSDDGGPRRCAHERSGFSHFSVTWVFIVSRYYNLPHPLIVGLGSVCQVLFTFPWSGSQDPSDYRDNFRWYQVFYAADMNLGTGKLEDYPIRKSGKVNLMIHRILGQRFVNATDT